MSSNCLGKQNSKKSCTAATGRFAAVIWSTVKERTTKTMPSHQSNILIESLKQMAKDAENWVVYARLNAVFDATAGDLCYHRQTTARKVRLKLQILHMTLLRWQSLFLIFSIITMHQMRFKEHLLPRLGGEWQAFAKGLDVFLTSKATIGSLLSESISQDLSKDEAKKIIEVGRILRRQILKSQNPLSGSFTSTCLTEPLPNSLLTLLAVLLDGSSSILSDEDRETIDSRIRVACVIFPIIDQ